MCKRGKLRGEDMINRNISVVILIPLLVSISIFGSLYLNTSPYKYIKPRINLSSYPNDNSTWDCTWGLNSSYRGKKITTDSENNSYVSGEVINEWGDTLKMFVVKFNASGEELWNFTSKIHGGYWGEQLSIDSALNIYTLGVNYNYPNTKWSLLKFNSSGDLLWNRTFAGRAECMDIDSFNNIYVSGNTFNSNTDVATLFLTKLNETGIIQWDYSVITNNIKHPSVISVDEFNNTYLAGIYSDGTENLVWHSGHFRYAADIFYWKFDQSGDLISNEVIDMGLLFISENMFFDKFAHLFLIGTEDSFDKCILFKFNSSGDIQLRIDWQNDAMDGSYDLWRNIAFDSFENIYCTSGNTVVMRFYEFYVVKFNSTGNLELEGAWKKYKNAYFRDSFVDLNSNIYFMGSCEYGVFLAKNPIFEPLSNSNYNPKQDPISPVAMIFGISILLGIVLYIRFRRKEKF